MKITKEYLKMVINEELQKELGEQAAMESEEVHENMNVQQALQAVQKDPRKKNALLAFLNKLMASDPTASAAGELGGMHGIAEKAKK